ncbi:Uncharacterized protein HZ326_30847 [Fusarium oxysporum f. sp. albedinis]|nr:Uncharacterized protein HZ326_30847 [Fusarium oxysporum f. sp. albedinis]
MRQYPCDRKSAAASPFIWGAKLHQMDKNGHRTWKQYEPQSGSQSPQVTWNRDDNNITTNLSAISLYLLTTAPCNQKQAPLQPPNIGN